MGPPALALPFPYVRQTQRIKDGEHPEEPSDLLSGREVQQAPEVPRDAVQEVAGVQVRPGQAALRQEAAGLRRTVQAHPQEEGQDDEEDRAAHGVPGVQAAHPGGSEAGEALRVGRRQEEEGADDPVLRGSPLLLCCVLCPLNAPAPTTYAE